MTSGLLFSRSQKKGSLTFSPCQVEMCSTCLALGGSGACPAASTQPAVSRPRTQRNRNDFMEDSGSGGAQVWGRRPELPRGLLAAAGVRQGGTPGILPVSSVHIRPGRHPPHGAVLPEKI